MACDAVKTKVEVEETVVDDPVSPTGQYFNSSVLSIGILAIFESDVAIDDSPTMSTLENLFLPIHPRFSSVMVKDDHGVRGWKRVALKLEDHVNVPVFPAGLETYDDYIRGYISDIAVAEFSQSRPLWDLHILKYPTKSAAGTMVFRIHHALGDGFSLMSALFSCFRRADDPSLPLTFPSSRATKPVQGSGAWWRAWRNVPRALSVCMTTVRDFGWSLLKTNYLADDRTPVRSEEAGVEFRPMEISTVTLSLDEVRHVKAKLGVTVNDVISGTIFYGTQLYFQAAAPGSKEARVTALVLLNTRMIASYQSLKEMTGPDATNPWGNRFGFLHVPVPVSGNPDASDPLSFVLKARQIIKAKKSSLAAHLNGRLLETIRKLRGAEVVDYRNLQRYRTACRELEEFSSTFDLIVDCCSIHTFHPEKHKHDHIKPGWTNGADDHSRSSNRELLLHDGGQPSEPHRIGGQLHGEAEGGHGHREGVHRCRTPRLLHGAVLSEDLRGCCRQES